LEQNETRKNKKYAAYLHHTAVQCGYVRPRRLSAAPHCTARHRNAPQVRIAYGVIELLTSFFLFLFGFPFLLTLTACFCLQRFHVDGHYTTLIGSHILQVKTIIGALPRCSDDRKCRKLPFAPTDVGTQCNCDAAIARIRVRENPKFTIIIVKLNVM